MTPEEMATYRQFRELCLKNAEDALRAAELLHQNAVNHIVFHLTVLALEEIGKIFIGWHNLSAMETWENEKPVIPLDDHIKKLFWAIWGPSLGVEKVRRESIEENRGFATRLHAARLDYLYTDLNDSQPAAGKVSAEEADQMIWLAKSRLALAREEGDVGDGSEQSEERQWFSRAMDSPERRGFIFGDAAQEKLVELGNLDTWFSWLKTHFEQEDEALHAMVVTELNRKAAAPTVELVPKWKMKYKILTPSHALRQNVLEAFNKRFPVIQLFRGRDSHTLYMEVLLDQSVLAKDLWMKGWMVSKFFVASLNVASNGLFFWNVPVDTKDYCEEIWDLENNKKVALRLETQLVLGWHERKLKLSDDKLDHAAVVFKYFLSPKRKSDYLFINEYMGGLAFLAKTDIHLRLEREAFFQFYICLKKALMACESCLATEVKKIGYSQLEKMITHKDFFDRVLDLGAVIENGQWTPDQRITLAEVISMKQYAGFYLMTLAARNQGGDDTLRLIGQL